MSNATARPLRRDAVRNYERILEAARDVLAEHGADASMEAIASRAGVGVGTVYRRFDSKDALIDEMLRLAMDQLVAAAESALLRTDGYGLQEFLRALGQSFADHAKYADLLLERRPDPAAANRIVQAMTELTGRASAAGTIGPAVTTDDVLALASALRGLVQTSPNLRPAAWHRFLDVHLAGLRAMNAAG